MEGSGEISRRLFLLDFAAEESKLVQVMDWWRQATSDYLR